MKHHKCSFKQFNKKVEEINMPEYDFRYFAKTKDVRVYRKGVDHNLEGYYKALCEFNPWQFRKGSIEDIKKGVIFADKHVKINENRWFEVYETIKIKLEV